MIQLLIDYAVPVSLFFLMLIAGTDVSTANVRSIARSRAALVLGTVGQLASLPLLALLIQGMMAPAPIIAASTLLLALCPGGGISNYYCYLARCNVLLSATITAFGTLLSLLTIPAYLLLLSTITPRIATLAEVPAGPILLQLIALMIVPMVSGALLTRAFPHMVEKAGPVLRATSGLSILAILALAVWSARAMIENHVSDILICATLFIVGAMLVGWLLGMGQSGRDRPVLVIESGTRNVGVALLLGSAILSPGSFAVFASFLAVYFAVEVVIMLIYARIQAGRILD